MIGLSIDSQNDIVENALGRTLKKENAKYSHVDNIKAAVKNINVFNIPIKLNTVLTVLNWNENLRDLFLYIKPIRWKVFEVHRICGVNDHFFETYGKLYKWQLDYFLNTHKSLQPVFESSKMMLDSYSMITPDGRFYQNTRNEHHYSEPILDMGVNVAINQVVFYRSKYLMRKGAYFRNL